MCLEIHRKRIIAIVARESLKSQSVGVKKTGSTGSRNPENKKEREEERAREKRLNSCRMTAKSVGQGEPQKLMDRTGKLNGRRSIMSLRCRGRTWEVL